MQPPLGTRYRSRVPYRGLQQDIGGVGPHFGAGRPHHAADRRCRSIVDDQDIGGIELALDTVEGHGGLAGPGEPHSEGSADPVAVVGVHGVAKFEHHVIGHVDRRTGRADTAEQQSALQPPGRYRGGVDPDDRA
ncbi:Uncharacterised protein [Mycobacterium tuberculosis]|uniref:Uncharacterized protein n=1 Tax=Mycobacterium tuberculosis TaxID=1773 RepID=A0A655ATL6_MYCTX|nr:Uncharacterised protein [Mycobacterium tuberculosis]CKT00849.1 Uncharacterised protein [Mycobacterium tuberculosis]CKT98998.1 Uncharacterised protein [Mycobacterium tuberculosis]CNH01339.1 Uncharacterised protein [Mycobacterium tuberculosis]CNL31966.1 Uncharacterised protein [Mycobacterium tuberculosis]